VAHDPDAVPAADDVARLGRFAVELATGAAAVVREAASTLSAAQLAVAAKSTATDLVTAVDRQVEDWLVARIRGRRPQDAILGEERGGRGGSSGVRWLIDPIDGTVNFVLGLPQYAVSVAAEVDGRLVAGAVCNPASGELFRASLGGGAFLGETRLAGPREITLARAVIGTGFAYDAGRRARQAAVVLQLLPQIADIRRLGSASLDLCAVAAGRLDGYFEAGLSPWDYAAGALIATEAGCAVIGADAAANGSGFVAVAGAALAADLFAVLRQLGAATA
jgi:myo-inositol-1(or 4)-monophosphatase